MVHLRSCSSPDQLKWLLRDWATVRSRQVDKALLNRVLIGDSRHFPSLVSRVLAFLLEETTWESLGVGGEIIIINKPTTLIITVHFGWSTSKCYVANSTLRSRLWISEISSSFSLLEGLGSRLNLKNKPSVPLLIISKRKGVFINILSLPLPLI